MPFFDPTEQQRLMQQMFANPQGGAPFQVPQGQGGVGQNAPQIGPSFVGPGDMGEGQGSMPNDLGVEPPQGFNRMPPNIGDEAMAMQPPNIGDGAMVQGQIPGMSGGGAPIDGGMINPELREKLIEAIMKRQLGGY